MPPRVSKSSSPRKLSPRKSSPRRTSPRRTSPRVMSMTEEEKEHNTMRMDINYGLYFLILIVSAAMLAWVSFLGVKDQTIADIGGANDLGVARFPFNYLMYAAVSLLSLMIICSLSVMFLDYAVVREGGGMSPNTFRMLSNMNIMLLVLFSIGLIVVGSLSVNAYLRLKEKSRDDDDAAGATDADELLHIFKYEQLGIATIVAGGITLLSTTHPFYWLNKSIFN